MEQHTIRSQLSGLMPEEAKNISVTHSYADFSALGSFWFSNGLNGSHVSHALVLCAKVLSHPSVFFLILCLISLD